MSLPPPPTTAPSSSSNNNNHHAPPPPPGPGTPPMARARLASILTETTAELEGLRSAYHEAQRRAKHFEDLANSLKVVSGNASEDQIRQHIQQLEQRTRDAEIARDTETARRVAITEMWSQLRDYLETVETHSRDARMGFDRIMQTGGGALQVLPPPKLNDHAAHRPYMPHPGPGPGYHSRVRHREDNGGEGPPPKKSRISSQPSYPGPPQHGYPPPRSHRQRSPSRTPSDGSLDVDEMLLRTAENDGRQPQQQAQQQGHRGQPYPPPPPPHDNPYPPPPPPHQQHLQPAMSTYQTHVFAPVVTGAPMKKGASGSKSFSEKPNNHSFAVNPQPSSSKSMNNGSGPPTYPFTPPTIPIPSHNEEGQRLCRQCGQAGRYKDGKCVEKWGPGPLGPGTVCDRCRKKMKRVERRGTADGASLGQVHSGSFREEMTHSHPPPPQSLSRTDTVVSQSGFESPAMRAMEPPPPRQSSSVSPQIAKRPSPQTRTPPTSSPRTQVPAPPPVRVLDYPRPTSPAATSKSDLDADADADEDELAEDTQETMVAPQNHSQRWAEEERPKKVSPPTSEPQGESRKNGHELPNGKVKTQPTGDVDMDILAAVDAAEEA